MNICSINTINFGAKIQFDNNIPERKQSLPQKGRTFCRKTYTAARRIFIVPIFFSAILSKVTKVRKSIKLPS